MPAHATTVAEYCGVLAKSRLVPEAEVQTLVAKWKQESQGADADLDSFRKFLVQKKCVTEYQAALVQRGHTEGFFVGGYVILDRIGKGQTAGVYKAVHTSGQVVALKVLPASKARDPNALNRFQREGRLLTQLDHPNVVRAFQVGQTGNVHFIVMEHLDGETLDEVVARRRRLPTGEAVRLVQQALLGLQHLHEQRMVHRDLKPSNLMVTPTPGPGQPDATLDATLKILDIGIGREMFDEGSPSTQDIELTREGAILGTPDYLAPEQARDARAADIRSDVYGLGCVLFYLIAGRPPFPDRNVMAQMVKHATEAFPPLSAVTQDAPPGLQGVFERLTAKKPADRYQTPADAAAALGPFLPTAAGRVESSMVLPAYKQWLESESGMDEPIDVTKLPPLAAPSGPVRPTVARVVAPPPPPAEEDSEIDVELVDGPRREVRVPLYPHTRRDFLMLGVGAGAVLGAIGVGFGLAKVLKKPDPPREE